MRAIGASTAAGLPVTAAGLPVTEARPEPRQVEARRTPVSRADLRGAIARAHEKLTGRAPSSALLDTLTAHASLETGSGAQMYNYNFGGIKGTSPSGETARCRTKEVEGGREVEVRDGFRAYRSLDDGALDYVRLMRDRFGAAVSRAESADVEGFAHALKKASYYTADETKYASALRALAGASPGVQTRGPTLEPTAVRGPATHSLVDVLPSTTNEASPIARTFPDSIELGRVLDAIARHPHTVVDTDDDD